MSIYNPRFEAFANYVEEQYHNNTRRPSRLQPDPLNLSTLLFDSHLLRSSTQDDAAYLLSNESEAEFRRAPFRGIAFTRFPFPPSLVSSEAFTNSPLWTEYLAGGLPIPCRRAHLRAFSELIDVLGNYSDQISRQLDREALTGRRIPKSAHPVLKSIRKTLDDLEAFVPAVAAASKSWTHNPIHPWAEYPSQKETEAWVDDGKIVKEAMWAHPGYHHLFNPYGSWHIISRHMAEGRGQPEWMDGRHAELNELVVETGDVYELFGGHRASAHSW